jgi:RsiW-degrading membrane proteinase PrsW (M82 family)
MSGIWLLFLLILISALPIIPAWFCFRSFKLGSRCFLFSIAAGLVSVLAAILVQSLFPLPAPGTGGPGPVLFGIFVRIALVEELSRFLTLVPLIGLYSRQARDSRPAVAAPAIGLAAGMGFTVVETALYAAASPGIALLRAFTAAPLHAACGARVGASIGLARSQPLRSVFLLIAAVLIHGMYDFFIIYPGIPSFLSVLIALSALGSSILGFRHGEKKD